MEDSKKKPVMIGVIVACLVLAGLVTYISSRGSSGIDAIPQSEMIWLKCNNQDCNAEYQISKRDYYKAREQGQVACKECGKESVFQAEKCEKCGLVFFLDIPQGGMSVTPGSGDFIDRCPDCGYSKIEEQREKAAETR